MILVDNKEANTIPFNRHLISLACVAIIASGGTYKLMDIKQERARQQSELTYPHGEDLAKVNATYETIVSNYVGEIDKNELINGAIKGMTTALDDPYSDYLVDDESEDLNETITGSFEGIGATMQVDGDQPKIAEPPIKDSPAEKAKLKANDLILKVDGKETAGQELIEVVSKIRGKKGTEVTLTIERDGKVFDVTLTRDTIPIETVFSNIDKNDKTVGNIRVATFTEHTSQEFQDAIVDLRKAGAKSFIIDMRQNPGGLLDQAAIMSSMFLKDGKTIVKFEDKNENKEQLVASKNLDGGFKVTEPTVVLVNEGSASASEIFAAALNESADIKVVGATTFGKGTMQNVQSLGNNSNLKLTTNKWLTPKGTWVNEKGLKPSVTVDFPSYYDSIPIDRSQSFKLGDNGEEIKNINLILNGLGYDVPKDSDSYSEQTEASIKEVQEKAKLEVTGSLDKETATAIEMALYEQIIKNDLIYEAGLKALTK